ncbi:MAG TPA: formimidoylglutamase [Chitinophagales bacterium]|nr:formimidoylglutamase [Chitinophagales bacterium]
MIEDILSPLPWSIIEKYKTLPPNRWGSNVEFFTGDLPHLEDVHLAIIGLKEDRGAVDNEGCFDSAGDVREQLYHLASHYQSLKIWDLGNIEKGSQLSDTYFGISSVVAELLKHKVIPVIIGGSHDLTCAQFRGYAALEKEVNVAIIDERIDLEEMEGEITDQNHLSRIITGNPPFLENLSLIGYQSHFSDPKSAETLEKLGFDCLRLGVVRKDLEEVEPHVRDADMISFDISAIRQADAPAVKGATPNGFTGEEACQICRYAGLSDRLSSIGIYNFNPVFDRNDQTAQLIAQMIWYFTEGFYNRKDDKLTLSEKDFYRYIVHLEEGHHDLHFWKSRKSDRWWLEIAVPPSPGKKKAKPLLVPCSYTDYKIASAGELPERWIKAQLKVAAI